MSVSRKAVRKETLDDIGERIEELTRLTNPVRHVMRSGAAANPSKAGSSCYHCSFMHHLQG